MFSSTTIASSMTMPTASVSASIVIELSVKPMYQMRPKVAMIDVGIAIAEMIVERREDRADDQVLLDVVDRRLDELRGVAHHADVVAGRERRLQIVQAPEHGIDDLDGVRARLPTDLQQHGARAVDVRDGIGVALAVLHLRDVGDPHRMPVLLADDHVVELRDGLHPAAPAAR